MTDITAGQDSSFSWFMLKFQVDHPLSSPLDKNMFFALCAEAHHFPFYSVLPRLCHDIIPSLSGQNKYRLYYTTANIHYK